MSNSSQRTQVLNKLKYSNKNDRLRVVIYTRKSVDDRAGNQSLADQESICRGWAAQNNCEVVNVQSEVISGAAEKREVFDQVINTILDRRNNLDGILVAKPDRLGREANKLSSTVRKLIKAGKHVISANDPMYQFGPRFPQNSPDGVEFLFKNMIAAIERAMHCQRTKAAMAERRTRGHGISRHSVFGYRFSVIDINGNAHKSYHSPDLKKFRPRDKPILVEEDPNEQAQIKALIQYIDSKYSDDSDTHVTGSELLNHLRKIGLDQNHRQSPPTPLSHPGNLRKNFLKSLEYAKSIGSNGS